MAVKDKQTKEKVRKPKRKKAGQTPPSGRLLRIRLVRSLIGRPSRQREVIKGLGLRKLNSEVLRKDGPETRGMIRKVSHLVKVEAVEEK